MQNIGDSGGLERLREHQNKTKTKKVNCNVNGAIQIIRDIVFTFLTPHVTFLFQNTLC